jgi:hypothetical protein
MVWNLKDHTLTIIVSQLTNAKKWLLVLVCLLTFIRIDWILTTYHSTYMNDQIECEKTNINELVICGCIRRIFFICN